MKFAHSIQFNAVPEWSAHYIAYSNLKKMYVPFSPSPAALCYSTAPIGCDITQWTDVNLFSGGSIASHTIVVC